MMNYNVIVSLLVAFLAWHNFNGKPTGAFAGSQFVRYSCKNIRCNFYYLTELHNVHKTYINLYWLGKNCSYR